MKYFTKGNVSPQGKPKVYFTGHPKDCELYFEQIKDMIFSHHDCAIFYDEDPEHPEDAENFISDLDRMQLIVLVVTGRYVYGDTFAHNTVFRHAMERHIPVLPILEERGIERDFNKKCGDLQYLDPNVKDDTSITFEEKLQKFLSSVLVGDELASKVRDAFDAYIFLSYRKKDRRYAQQLMHLIHQNPFCRDIAIWYDEFLVPGENFNDAIAKAMQKSELFAMVVTPNLLENPNYVMSTEYPAAKNADKKILPAVLVPTEENELKRCYEGIPETVDPENIEALAAALSDALKNVAVLENDGDPRHMFFIGLAYLSGIDVEVNYELAVRIITDAAESGLPEAIEKLVAMYRNGEGVARDYHAAIRWQEKLVEVRRIDYEAEASEGKGSRWFDALYDLGDFLYELGQLAQAEKVYQDMLKAAQLLDKTYHVVWTRLALAISYSKLGIIRSALGDLSGALVFFEKDLSVSEQLAEETGLVTTWRDLSISYNHLGDIRRALGDLTGALSFYEKSFAIREQLAEETGTLEARRDLAISYERLGDIRRALGDIAGALAFYEKSLAIREQLAEETGTVLARRDLAISYDRLGDIRRALGDIAGALAFYEKSLAIREQLAEETGTVEARRDLAICYDRLGDIRRALGDIAGALSFYEKSLAIREALAVETENVNLRQDLSISYERLGDIRRALGDLAGAQAFYEKDLAISEQLAEETGTVEARRGLAISYECLGDIRHALGDLAGAQAFYEKSLAIREQLAEETGTVEARRDLAISYGHLGDIRRELGDIAGALAFYEKDLAISEQLAEETGTLEARRGLAICYERLGDIGHAQRDLTLALSFYEKSLAIREQLAEETGTVEALRDLSIGYERLGDIRRALGDIAGAQVFFEKELAISEQLVEETGTVEAYDDIAVSYYNMFTIADTEEEVQAYLRKAEKIWSRLVEVCPDVPSYKERLAMVREDIE